MRLIQTLAFERSTVTDADGATRPETDAEAQERMLGPFRGWLARTWGFVPDAIMGGIAGDNVTLTAAFEDAPVQ